MISQAVFGEIDLLWEAYDEQLQAGLLITHQTTNQLQQWNKPSVVINTYIEVE